MIKTYQFGGRKSGGCNRCRSGKVKVRHVYHITSSNDLLIYKSLPQCDERRPSCMRCSRADKSCEYRNTLDLVFHDQTQYTSRRAKALWRKRSKEEDVDNSHISGSVESSTVIQASISPPLYDVAVQRFFYDYVFPGNPSKNRAGHLEHLFTKHQTLSQDLHFALALKATAIANFALRCKSPEAADMALSEYNRAIYAVNSALEDPQSAKKDTLLLACYLLTLCEV